MVSLTPHTAQTGRISPGRRGSDDDSSHPNIRGRRRPSYMNRSIWRRYSEHHRCHPKNVCSGCCYRPTEWSGYRWVELVPPAYLDMVTKAFLLYFMQSSAHFQVVQSLWLRAPQSISIDTVLALMLALFFLWWLLVSFSVSLLCCVLWWL